MTKARRSTNSSRSKPSSADSSTSVSGTASPTGRAEQGPDIEVVAERIDNVSMGLGIASGVATVGAIVAAPTGLTAVGVAIGVISPPFIVAAAPVIGTVAAVAGAVSGTAYFYKKWKRRQSVGTTFMSPPGNVTSGPFYRDQD